jgi:hypothetical protein
MSNLPLIPPRAPNLPLAPGQYEPNYLEKLTNALRLYFNTIDNGFNAILGREGGAYLQLPFIAASDSTDQLATASDTPTVIAWNTLEGGNGFTLNAPGSATALVSGVYKITYSLQFANTDNASHDAAVWLKINNVDVPRSTTVFSIPARKSAGVFAYVCGYSEVVFTLNAGDEMELYWATGRAYDNSPAVAGVYIKAIAAQSVPYVRPATPSALGSITFLSAL